MKRPPGTNGVAFTDGSQGDQRKDPGARAAVSSLLGISPEWATVRQVHGHRVVEVSEPGEAEEADGIWTRRQGLPLSVFTADCFGVVLVAENAAGVAHSGWRGADSRVVRSLRSEMSLAGHRPIRAAIGPGIGPCCFEVGPEVAARFPHDITQTSWGTTSVDLVSVLRRDLEGLEVWSYGACTMHRAGLFSHRENQTVQRLATIGWVP